MDSADKVVKEYSELGDSLDKLTQAVKDQGESNDRFKTEFVKYQ